MNRVYRWDKETSRGYLGLALHTYQITLGITLRWYEWQPQIRIYLGPLKIYAGLFLRSQPAFIGGDR